MITIYRLHDLDYDIFVIMDNILELPLTDHETSVERLKDILRGVGCIGITVEHAIEVLENS